MITRRRFLTGLLVAAGGLFALSQVVLLGSLGPRPHRRLFHTSWRAGSRLVTFDGVPVTRDTLAAGTFLVAFPEGHLDAADSQIIAAALRRRPALQDARRAARRWSPEGYVAYSRVCTHAGCPVAQYEDQAQGAGVPVPPVDLRPDERRPAGRRPGRPGAAAAPAGHRRAGRPARPERLHRSPSGPASGTRDERAPSQESLGRAFGAAPSPARRAARWLDRNLGGSSILREELRHIFPDSWAFFLGEIALYCFIVLVVTGIFLALFFHASQAHRRLPRQLPPAARRADVRRLQLRPRPELERARRPAGPPGAPLGGARLRRRPDHPPDAHVLHRRLPAAAAHQLAHRPLAPPSGRLQRAHWATRSRTTCSPAPACASPSRSPSRSRSSGPAGLGAVRRRLPQPPGSSPRIYPVHIFLLPAAIAGLLGAHLGLLWLQRHTRVPGAGTRRPHHGRLAAWSRRTRCAPPATSCCSPACSPPSARAADQPRVALRPVPRDRRHQSRPSPTGTWAGSRAPCACSPAGTSRSAGSCCRPSSGRPWSCRGSSSRPSSSGRGSTASRCATTGSTTCCSTPRSAPAAWPSAPAFFTFLTVLLVGGGDDVFAILFRASAALRGACGRCLLRTLQARW